MGQGRSMQMSDSQLAGNIRSRITQKDFIFDLVEFWIAGVIGLAIFGSIVVTTVHGGLPWECEEHVKIVSGAADLGLRHNITMDASRSHYECEYMTSTAEFENSGGMCPGCDVANKKTICNAHAESLGCHFYEKDKDIVSVSGDADPQRNWQKCRPADTTDLTTGTANSVATESCCLYKAPATDDQLHDVCYSIDQYVKDEHYPNFEGKYKDQVKDARTFAMLAYSFGFAAFAARLLYHIPALSNFLGNDNLAARDYWVRLADLAFLIAAFVFTILTFTQLDDVLMDNRKHLWGEEGVFKHKAHRDAVEEQLVAGTGFYALAVYATLLGVNVVWFLGTQVGIIPNHGTHMSGDGVELRGIAFRSEHA